ncbi:MAG TPA: universal stress protein [Roseovarius sp.]|jgi:nucleotide-binding universal stress UspA family protein|nr:universal stress protein [Roseovarius sp.]
MKTHILVATDGSDTANKAIDLAAELAAKFDVPLTVGHVLQFGRPSRELARMAEVEHIVESVQKTQQVDFNILSGAGGGDLFATSRPSSDMVRVITLMGEEIVNRAADRARAAGAKQVDTLTADDDPADGILDMAEKAGADMIVMGHRGLGRVRSLLAGSVAQKVNNHAECTVVTVR